MWTERLGAESLPLHPSSSGSSRDRHQRDASAFKQTRAALHGQRDSGRRAGRACTQQRPRRAAGFEPPQAGPRAAALPCHPVPGCRPWRCRSATATPAQPGARAGSGAGPAAGRRRGTCWRLQHTPSTARLGRETNRSCNARCKPASMAAAGPGRACQHKTLTTQAPPTWHARPGGAGTAPPSSDNRTRGGWSARYCSRARLYCRKLTAPRAAATRPSGSCRNKAPRRRTNLSTSAAGGEKKWSGCAAQTHPHGMHTRGARHSDTWQCRQGEGGLPGGTAPTCVPECQLGRPVDCCQHVVGPHGPVQLQLTQQLPLDAPHRVEKPVGAVVCAGTPGRHCIKALPAPPATAARA